ATTTVENARAMASTWRPPGANPKSESRNPLTVTVFGGGFGASSAPGGSRTQGVAWRFRAWKRHAYPPPLRVGMHESDQNHNPLIQRELRARHDLPRPMIGTGPKRGTWTTPQSVTIRKSETIPLRQHLLHDVAMNVGEPVVAALEAVRQPLVVD